MLRFTLWLLWIAVPLLGTAAERPNVLFLLADDQRPDTIQGLGNSVIRTPNLDRLVAEGLVFPRAITAIPICVASRAEMLTGCDGLQNGKADYGFSPRDGVMCWAESMRHAGYHTGYVGKWHTSGRPSQRGYMQSTGLYSSGGGKLPLTFPVDWKKMPVTGYTGWVFQTDAGQTFPERGVGLTPDISEAFAEAAIEFIREPRQQPFFLHVNFTAPHDPLILPSRFRDAYDPQKIPLPNNFAAQHPFDHGNYDGRDEQLFHWPRTPEETRGALAVYYAVIEHLDEQVGRILAALEASGQLDNTLIIYSSDHGLAMGSHGLRGKQNMYEHSIGVPLIWRGPGIPSGQTASTQCYLRDLFPTVCDLCGVDIPASVQGRSLRPAIDDRQHQVYDAVVAHFRDSQRMIRTDQWKYIEYPLAKRRQLFQLTRDPHELVNLVDEPGYEKIASDLQVRLDAAFKDATP